MMEVLTETSQDEEDDSPDDGEEAVEKEIWSLESYRGKQVLRKRGTKYYDKKQQLDIILAAQGLLDDAEYEAEGAHIGSNEACDDDSSKADIWDPQESKRIRRRAKQYYWKDGKLYFRGLYVPKPDDRLKLITQMHEDLGHFGEQRTLAEICQRYFWSNRTECVKAMVRSCKQCQLLEVRVAYGLGMNV
jgi:hypothetical protein